MKKCRHSGAPWKDAVLVGSATVLPAPTRFLFFSESCVWRDLQSSQVHTFRSAMFLAIVIAEFNERFGESIFSLPFARTSFRSFSVHGQTELSVVHCFLMQPRQRYCQVLESISDFRLLFARSLLPILLRYFVKLVVEFAGK